MLANANATKTKYNYKKFFDDTFPKLSRDRNLELII